MYRFLLCALSSPPSEKCAARGSVHRRPVLNFSERRTKPKREIDPVGDVGLELEARFLCILRNTQPVIASGEAGVDGGKKIVA